MRKLIAAAILLTSAILTTQAQISGLNLNQITNMLSPQRMMQSLPNSTMSQGAMLGLDPNTMKLLSGIGNEEIDKPKTGQISTKPGEILAPQLIDGTPVYMSETETGNSTYDVLFKQFEQMRKLQDSLGFLQSKLDGINADSTKKLQVWGYNFFNSELLETFIKSADIKAADSYIINVDDEITLAVWGYADYNGTFRVNKEGYIQIPEFGRVYVKGLTFGATKELIAKRLASFINPQNTKYEITLNFSRNIVINILGEVTTPGTYMIPAINSVFNALNAASGPSLLGSVRNIEVRRDGRIVKSLDVYQFLLDPDPKNNFYLQENDIIYVPIQGKTIELTGAVRRSNKFELKPNEGLADIIRFAGGLKADAYTKLIKVERIINQKIEIVNISLDDVLSGISKFELKDGDKIFIPAISVASEDAVEITGNVLLPSKYQFKEGFRVADIIKISGGLLPNTYMDRAYLRRKMDDGTYVLNIINLKNIFMSEEAADNVLLQKQDKLEVFSREVFQEKFTVSITGSVRKPVKIDYSDGLTLNDLIFYAGGLKREAANNLIEISRVINVNKEMDKYEPQRVVVRKIEIGANLEIDEASKGFALSPMDQVFVRRSENFEEIRNVAIQGEVKFPGTYPILAKNETVLDLINRAGGLTPYAHVNSARLFRKDSVNAIEVLDLKAAFSDSTSYANYALIDGDIIEIPTMNPMVSVKGAIKYPGADSMRYVSAKFIPGKRAIHYINVVGGGYAPRAKRKMTMVLHPNGDVGRTKSILGIKRYPLVREGSQVMTYYKPPKPESVPVPKQPLNWNLILPSIIISVASVTSTIVLIGILSQ